MSPQPLSWHQGQPDFCVSDVIQLCTWRKGETAVCRYELLQRLSPGESMDVGGWSSRWGASSALSAAVLESRPSGFQRMSPALPHAEKHLLSPRRFVPASTNHMTKKGPLYCLAPRDAGLVPLQRSPTVLGFPPGDSLPSGSHGHLHVRTRCAGVGQPFIDVTGAGCGA